LVVAVKGDKRCKVNSGALKIFNNYYINKQQVFKANNSFKYTDEKVMKSLGKDAVSIN